MSNIMLMIHRNMITQGLIDRLLENPHIRLLYEPDYENANISINRSNIQVALIEAGESGIYDIDYCLALCKRLRRHVPECKLLLMCPEQDEHSVKQVVNAKLEKEIDDFVFYDVTMDYLASKLISLK